MSKKRVRCLDQDRSCRDEEELVDLDWTLEIALTTLTDGLDSNRRRRGRIKGNSQVYCLDNDGLFITYSPIFLFNK